MITVYNTVPPTYYGKKSETKPTQDIQNGAKFVEIDTHEEFLFDAEGKQWHGKPTPEP